MKQIVIPAPLSSAKDGEARDILIQEWQNYIHAAKPKTKIVTHTSMSVITDTIGPKEAFEKCDVLLKRVFEKLGKPVPAVTKSFIALALELVSFEKAETVFSANLKTQEDEYRSIAEADFCLNENNKEFCLITLNNENDEPVSIVPFDSWKEAVEFYCEYADMITEA